MESALDITSANHGSDREKQAKENSELERDLQALAQLLLEVYLWGIEERRAAPGSEEVDKRSPPTTM
jgi:hypothetical protein